MTETAQLVVGADGRHSAVAKAVRAPAYRVVPPLTTAYYTYWSGVELAGGEIYGRQRCVQRLVGAWPTNDGLVMTYVAAPASEFHAFRADPEGDDPGRARRAAATSASGSAPASAPSASSAPPTPQNRFHVPHGPGWALVGDAGLVMDPVTGAGIADALRDAELLPDAVAAGLDGGPPLDEALAGYQAARDAAALPMYEMTVDLASFAPPRPEQEMLLRALEGNQAEIDRFLSVLDRQPPGPGVLHPAQHAAAHRGARGLAGDALAEEDARMSEPVGTLTDADLVRAAQAGDTAGLGALLERHRSRLHAIAVSILGHGPQAEDAVQDACVIALRRIGELRDPAAARAWLTAILVNVCRGQLRSARAGVPGVDPWDPPGPDTAAQAIDDGALRDWVWTALERLSEPLRLAVMLRYFTGASSYEAIAELCGVPVGTVRSRLSTAKRRLAEELLETAAFAHDEAMARWRRAAPLGEAYLRLERDGDVNAFRRRPDRRRRVRHVRPHRAPRRDPLRARRWPATSRTASAHASARSSPAARSRSSRPGSTARPTSRCTAHPA